ncbi:hypothetical protein [Hoeflea sp.]|uniref:hypothetical protein n=1 Tax=Hoeflea sp. TaxID=1940281 RepID=UPI0019BAEBF1|nr:hypothetical protein [Hoeflea sp.]MBC7281265.1 hypothetical protein [Hoeflea sp.]
MLSGLIQQFERLASELLAAAYHEDEAKVDRIDGQIQDLIDRLSRIRVHSRNDITAQIGFFKRLAQQNCEDGSSVRRYTDTMASLFDRYMDLNTGLNPGGGGLMAAPVHEGYDPSVHELAFDCLQERVAIIGLDYRYIYLQQAQCRFSPEAGVRLHRPASV